MASDACAKLGQAQAPICAMESECMLAREVKESCAFAYLPRGSSSVIVPRRPYLGSGAWFIGRAFVTDLGYHVQTRTVD